MAYAFKENAWWYWSSSRSDVRKLVCLRVIFSGDVVEFIAVESSLQCVVELLVGHHVVCNRVAVPYRLLDDEVGVTVD